MREHRDGGPTDFDLYLSYGKITKNLLQPMDSLWTLSDLVSIKSPLVAQIFSHFTITQT